MKFPEGKKPETKKTPPNSSILRILRALTLALGTMVLPNTGEASHKNTENKKIEKPILDSVATEAKSNVLSLSHKLLSSINSLGQVQDKYMDGREKEFFKKLLTLENEQEVLDELLENIFKEYPELRKERRLILEFILMYSDKQKALVDYFKGFNLSGNHEETPDRIISYIFEKIDHKGSSSIDMSDQYNDLKNVVEEVTKYLPKRIPVSVVGSSILRYEKYKGLVLSPAILEISAVLFILREEKKLRELPIRART